MKKRMPELPEKIFELLMEFTNYHWIRHLLVKSHIYLVGGCVRDAYRDKPLKDIDIIVEGLTLAEIKHILLPFGQVDIVGESFAVIKFKPTGYFGEPFDIAIPRTDRKTGNGHKGFDIQTKGVTIYQDLERRDFTINSIAIKCSSMEVIDPYNGIQDIEYGVLKATNSKAFIDDPLRILRGIQFAARFGYIFDIPTAKLMQENAHLIKDISGERIMDELMKIIKKNGNTQIALDLLHFYDVDLALFGKKMLRYDKGLEYLDAVSFFYVLGLLGDIDPSKFILQRLKGESSLAKNVKTLEKLFTKLPHVEHDDEDLLFMLSKCFSEAPAIMESVILPDSVQKVVLNMKMGQIPFSMKSVMLNGDDVKEISNNYNEGKWIQDILDRVLRDALMNRFNWNDRKDSMDYLTTLIYGKR